MGNNLNQTNNLQMQKAYLAASIAAMTGALSLDQDLILDHPDNNGKPQP